MDVYFIKSGPGGDMYCEHCADDFIYKGGDVNDIDGPYPDGGGKADLIHHCKCRAMCAKAMQTIFGPVGVCFYNDLTEVGIDYTIDALASYIGNGRAIAPEVLDLWAKELRNYTVSGTQYDILRKYSKIRATEKPGSFDRVIHSILKDQLILTKNKKKQDTKVDSMTAFFDDRPAVTEATYCKSCRDTGVIVLFNSSVECTDCTKSMNLTALEDIDIPF